MSNFRLIDEIFPDWKLPILLNIIIFPGIGHISDLLEGRSHSKYVDTSNWQTVFAQ